MNKNYIKLLEIVKNIMSRTTNFNGTFKERIEFLNDKEYNNIFKPIQIVEKDNLVLFRYGNYCDVFNGEADFGKSYTEFWQAYEGIYRVMRSVVIDISTCQIALYPFDKFFNLNEVDETSLDIVQDKIKTANSIEISDKLDGSMASARFYNGELIVTTSKSVVRSQSWRLDEIYKMIEDNSDLLKMIQENPNYTFVFESITKADMHVVYYSDSEFGLYLIGMRDMNTFEMLSYADIIKFAKKYNVKSTTVFDKTFDEVINSLDDKKSNEKEGFVLNIDGFYLKIKYNDYVLMHNILSKISSINLIIKNYADETLDDLLSKVPQAYRDRVYTIVNICNQYVTKIENEVDYWYNIVKDWDKKTIALYLQEHCNKTIMGYVFSKCNGKKYNILKKGTCGYKKLTDMGYNPKQYYQIFDE